jgi:hypothetical protein
LRIIGLLAIGSIPTLVIVTTLGSIEWLAASEGAERSERAAGRNRELPRSALGPVRRIQLHDRCAHGVVVDVGEPRPGPEPEGIAGPDPDPPPQPAARHLDHTVRGNVERSTDSGRSSSWKSQVAVRSDYFLRLDEHPRPGRREPRNFDDFPMATELLCFVVRSWAGVRSSSLTEGRLEVTGAKKARPLLER